MGAGHSLTVPGAAINAMYRQCLIFMASSVAPTLTLIGTISNLLVFLVQMLVVSTSLLELSCRSALVHPAAAMLTDDWVSSFSPRIMSPCSCSASASTPKDPGVPAWWEDSTTGCFWEPGSWPWCQWLGSCSALLSVDPMLVASHSWLLDLSLTPRTG